MKIHSYNEWDRLREVIVGSATNANWPVNDPVFSKEGEKTTWKQTPVPSGPVPQWIVDETNEDLDTLCGVLTKFGAMVRRPTDLDFIAIDGMYNYCPRDRFLIAGDTIVDVTMMYPCRDQEAHAYEFLLQHDHKIITMPRNQGMICDAANIARLGDRWVYLESASGNDLAAIWLSQIFPDIDIYGANFYSGVHIDSTIVPLREGTVMVNGSRVNTQNLPACFRDWEILVIEEVVEQPFYQYPWASKWIGMNCLSLDSNTVIVDAAQQGIISLLEQKKFDVIPLTLRHARTLGGGFHCVTLDTWRQND